MKNINLIILCALASCEPVLAQNTVVVDDDSKLLYPTASSFIEANSEFSNITKWGKITGVLSQQTDLQNAINSKTSTTYVNSQIESYKKYPRIIIDTSPTKSLNIEGDFTDFFPTDAELKFFDKNTGNISYWVSTARGFTDEYNYATMTDENVKIWFYMSALHQWGNNNNGIDFRKPIPFLADEFDSIAEQARAMIGSNITPQINGIIIEPNIDGNTSSGDSIADIFSSEDNVPIIMKLSSTEIEKNLDGKNVARPVNISYYKNPISSTTYSYILHNENFANWTASAPTGWLKNYNVKTLSKITTGLPSSYNTGIDFWTREDNISTNSFTLNKQLAKGKYLIQFRIFVSNSNVGTNDWFAMGFNTTNAIRLNFIEANFNIGEWTTKMFIVENIYSNAFFRIACYNPIKLTGLSIIKIN